MIIFVSADDGGIAFCLKDNRERACHTKIMMLALSKFNAPVVGTQAIRDI